MAYNPYDDIIKAALAQAKKKAAKAAKDKVKKSIPKPKPSGTVSGKPVGRIARTTPPRPKRDYYKKGKSIAETDAEKRAAERMANRMLKQFNTPKSKPAGNAKPVDVRGSIVQTPSKPTMRPSSPKGSSAYEADKLKAQIKADRDNFGRGQKRPKGKGNPPKEGGTGGVKAKPKPKKPSGSGGATATAKRLRDEAASAKSPAQRKAAQDKLMKHLLSTGSRRSKNIYK